MNPSVDSGDASQAGVELTLIVHEHRQHESEPAYQWLLKLAERLGLQGGTATRTLAGFGRYGVIYAEDALEVEGDVPIEVRFICSADDADRVLAEIGHTDLTLFYSMSPARFGLVGGTGAGLGEFLDAVVEE